MVSDLEKLTYLEVQHTRALTLDPVAKLKHLRCFRTGGFMHIVMELKGVRVDFAAPLAPLDELLELSGALHIENVERQIDRGTRVDGKGVQEMRRALFMRDMQQSQ